MKPGHWGMAGGLALLILAYFAYKEWSGQSWTFALGSPSPLAPSAMAPSAAAPVTTPTAGWSGQTLTAIAEPVPTVTVDLTQGLYAPGT